MTGFAIVATFEVEFGKMAVFMGGAAFTRCPLME